MADAERQILSALRLADYDLTKIPAATLAGFATAPVQAASLRVQQYVAQSCNTSTPTT